MDFGRVIRVAAFASGLAASQLVGLSALSVAKTSSVAKTPLNQSSERHTDRLFQKAGVCLTNPCPK